MTRGGMKYVMLAAAIMLWPVYALGQEAPPEAPPSEIRPSTLEELFAQLAATTDPQEAMFLDIAISENLDAAGGPTAQLLAQRALVSAEGGNFSMAMELADAAVAYAPRYAEGFNTRATIQALQDNYAGAMADLQQALAIEPRHYRALANVGAILESTEDNVKALEAYDRALALYPLYEEVRAAAEALRKKVDGDRI